MNLTPERSQALKMLPSIYSANPTIYIRSHSLEQDGEDISWTIFISPFTIHLWVLLFFVAVVTAIVLTTIEGCYEPNNIGWSVMNYLKNLWIASKANFGGKPNSVVRGFAAQRLMLFICLLSGTIIWIAYRGSLTSELSVIEKDIPFDDLESLSKSDYK